MILARLPLLVSILMLAALAASADDVPSFDKIAADPEPFHGQVVRFRYEFTRLLPGVNPLLAFRGITSSNYVQVATPPFGGLAILVNRQREDALAALKALEGATAIVVTGEVDRLRADNGAVFYYVDVARIERAPAAPEIKTPPVVPPVTGKDGPPKAGAPLELGEVLRTLDALDGRDIAIRVPYLGITRDLPAWAIEGAKLAPDTHAMLRFTILLAIVFPTADKAALARLEALTPGTALIAVGTVFRVKRGPFTVGVIVTKRIDVAPAPDGSGSSK